jgi:AhpD family alkylhydroperoxidase
MAGTVDHQQLLDQLATMREEVERKDPKFLEAWTKLSTQSKMPGALNIKQKELICVALSIAARCTYCIASHVKKAIDHGATRDEILEVSFVAVSMGGGPSLAYVTEVIQACDQFGAK